MMEKKLFSRALREISISLTIEKQKQITNKIIIINFNFNCSINFDLTKMQKKQENFALL